MHAPIRFSFLLLLCSLWLSACGGGGGDAQPNVQRYSIAATASPVDGGSISGTGSVVEGTSITVVATPNDGYTFVNWTEGGVEVSASGSYIFSATTNRTLVANFSLNNYVIDAAASPVEGGNVSGVGNYDHGTDITLDATPNNGYTFVNWTAGGAEVSVSSSYTFTATADLSVVANFSFNNYAIDAIASPIEGGSTTGAGDYDHGTNATLVATPNNGYTFINWTEGGAEVSASNSYTFVATASRSLVANFISNTEVLNGSYEGQKKSQLGVFEINLALTTFDISGTDITITFEDFFAETYIYTGQFSDVNSPMSASGTYVASDFSSGTWTSTKIAKTSIDAFITELEMNDGVNTNVVKFNGFLNTGSPVLYSNELDYYFDSGNYLDIGGAYEGSRVSRDACAASTFAISSSDTTIVLAGNTIEITQDEFFDGTCVFSGTVADISDLPLSASGTYMCSNFDQGTWSSSKIVLTGVDSFIAELSVDVPSRGCTYTKKYSGFK